MSSVVYVLGRERNIQLFARLLNHQYLNNHVFVSDCLDATAQYQYKIIHWLAQH